MTVHCTECGGTSVQRVYWVDINTRKVIEPFGDHDEHLHGKSWCDDCVDHTPLEGDDGFLYGSTGPSNVVEGGEAQRRANELADRLTETERTLREVRADRDELRDRLKRYENS